MYHCMRVVINMRTWRRSFKAEFARTVVATYLTQTFIPRIWKHLRMPLLAYCKNCVMDVFRAATINRSLVLP